MSRQYLVRLLDDGKLPYTKTGKHRRLRIEDVLTFKGKRDAERKASLEYASAGPCALRAAPRMAIATTTCRA